VSRLRKGLAPHSCKDFSPVEEVPDAPIIILGDCEKFRLPARVCLLDRG
jgi:hypothetical protein